MTRVFTSPDCGNSPKNKFIEKITIAFGTGDIETILGSVTADIRYDRAGGSCVVGIENFARELERLKEDEVEELVIQHVLTHGKAGAANGIKKLKNGTTFGFCNVFEFDGAKGARIRGITSYLVSFVDHSILEE